MRWVKVGDVIFAAVVVTAGLMISAEHEGWAVLLVSIGLGSFVIARLIQPLTERDALEALAPPMRRTPSAVARSPERATLLSCRARPLV